MSKAFVYCLMLLEPSLRFWLRLSKELLIGVCIFASVIGVLLGSRGSHVSQWWHMDGGDHVADSINTLGNPALSFPKQVNGGLHLVDALWKLAPPPYTLMFFLKRVHRVWVLSRVMLRFPRDVHYGLWNTSVPGQATSGESYASCSFVKCC